MKMLCVFLVLFCFTSDLSLSQDLNPSISISLGLRGVLVAPDNQGGKTLVLLNDLMLNSSPHSKLGIYLFLRDFFSYKDVNKSTGGVGFNYGNDSLRFYAGLGGHGEKTLVDVGIYWLPNTWNISAFVNMGLDYSLYDIRIIYNNILDDTKLGIGLYARSNLGIGFVSNYQPCQFLILHTGFGYDPQIDARVKLKIFLGMNLIYSDRKSK